VLLALLGKGRKEYERRTGTGQYTEKKESMNGFQLALE